MAKEMVYDMTVPEVSKILGVATSTIRMRIKNKTIDKKFYRKVGIQNLFSKEYLKNA